ncbi:hypothetical protein IWW36_004866 [Coemansia brasiliensis]|uniref:Uncharacterized protein n=1 Tax=Coemansia brasiliensis TaxID=2650707 RepID=A0A9W8I542_9FUNG|nr:hypothetical protein IWW36_004866 [Coemansia brasiliensis]
MTVRRATHAGSWYTGDGEQLNQELQRWLDNVPDEVPEIEPPGESCSLPIKGARAIIAPHAGYSYSGANAAYAYKCVDIETIKRVFLLGPSHHAYLTKCALSQCTKYATPLGDIQVDTEMIEELKANGEWEVMSTQVDEDEHSLEMHLPYIYKIFENKIDQIKLVPILVGNLSGLDELYYGESLSDYLYKEENLFIISSDFCHWGHRFGYTYYTTHNSSKILNPRGPPPLGQPIWESIQKLDFDGMEAIAEATWREYRCYMKETKNTICGRHAIGVLLGSLRALYLSPEPDVPYPRLRFIKYDQSNKVHNPSDSSVSYASAYLWLP